jgi:hypothetical protein
MLCDTCTYWAGDSDDNCVRFICGHHPNCPDFKIDKKSFGEYFNLRVEQHALKSAIRALAKEDDDIPVAEKLQRQSTKITKRLYEFLMRNRHFPIASNCYIYNWESDIITINKNKYISEYEIKISRADFKADFLKTDKHSFMSDVYNYNFSSEHVPNYFYYVTPPGLLDKKEIPEYSGLIEVGMYVRRVKRAPILHRLEANPNMEMNLMKKIYHKYWNNYDKKV